MTRSTRSWPAVAAAAVTSLAVSLLAAPFSALADEAHPAVAHPPIWSTGAGGERYVAFGDSFTSGPGIKTQRGQCMRSDKNFPTLVATALGATSFTDASCGGATTRHLTATQTSGDYVNQPQLDALSPDTTLVTFGTLGGNDIGLVGLAMGCADPETSCVPASGTDPLAQKFTDLRPRLVDGIRATKQRAPQADVVVIGYGTYLPKDGCPATFLGAVDAAESNYVQGQINRLSDLLADVAAEEGVHFVDQRKIPGAIDHTVCAWPDQQWLRGLETYDDGALLHPSTAGMKATADYVTSRITAFRTPVVTPPVVTPPNPGPTKAQRLAALRAKARTVKISSTCRGPRTASKRLLRTKVTGGRGAITKVVTRAGSKTLSVDRKAPWVTTKKARTVRKHLVRKSSRVTATVTLRDGSLSVTKKLKAKRVGCIR